MILGSSIFLYALNSFAQRYDLYYDVAWFDMITHALGGLIVAASFVYALVFVFKTRASMWKTIAFTLVIGVLWEILEAKSGMTVTTDALYPLDTAGDMFFDLFGAYLFTISYKGQTHGH